MNIAGKKVVFIGYGWVGRGMAIRAEGLGAEIIVVEIDPWKALEARMDGFQVMYLEKACSQGNIFITTTGSTMFLGKSKFPKCMKDLFWQMRDILIMKSMLRH